MKGRRWRNRKQGWSGTTKQTRAMDAAVGSGYRSGGSFGPAGPARSLLTGEIFPLVSTWHTIGAGCPWNTTPGKRQVWQDGKLLSAERTK